MSVETDGVEEAFEGQLRVLLTAAGQVGERLARAREESLRRAQADSEREAWELRSRFDAEHRTARAELGNVYRPDWWDQAGAEQIASAYAAARAWAHDDPEAVRAEQQLRQEVRSRYGIDLDATGADPTAVREAVQRAERLHEQPGADRRTAGVEQAETALLMSQADTADRAAKRSRAAAAPSRVDVGVVGSDAVRPAYDSPQRRNSTAAGLLEDAGIDKETVATRMRADVSQGRPAADATVTTAPKARRTLGTAPGIQRTTPGR